MRIRRNLGVMLASPLALLLILTIAVPAGTFFVYSFYKFVLLEPKAGFDLGNYRTALSDQLYHKLAWNSVAIAGPTTVLSVVFGYVLAYYLAFVASVRRRQVVLALIVISLMASYLVRIYAWRTLLGEQGLINDALRSVHVISEPLGFLLFSRFAVVVAQVNLFLPFTALVLYASLSGVSPQLAEGARDLGARRVETLRRVLLPLSGRAVLSAGALTFFLSAGDYITPVLLGGTNAETFGTAISDQLRITGDYPLGAALAFVMVAAFAVFYWLLRVLLRTTGVLPRAWKAVA
jgi:spermidine/putrescine transport system permease protein